jgi:hypothetical protein
LENGDEENSERAVQRCNLVVVQEKGTGAETLAVGDPVVVRASCVCQNKAVIGRMSEYGLLGCVLDGGAHKRLDNGVHVMLKPNPALRNWMMIDED